MNKRNLFTIDQWDFKRASILADLPAADQQILLANQTEHDYEKGEIIFRENGFPSGIFFIREGMVKKYKSNNEGHEQIIYIANAGELIGYHAILSEEFYPDSAAALEKSRIVFIPRDDFMLAVQTSEVLHKRLLKSLSHEFLVLSNRLSLFSMKSVRERLALQLILLHDKYKQSSAPGATVIIPISRKDLASIVGTARENLVRLLAEFKQQEIVLITRSNIVILDMEQLHMIGNK